MLKAFLISKGNLLIRSFQKTQFEIVIHRLSSFTTRHILYEGSDESGTLLTRLAKHVALELQCDAPIVPTSIRYSDYFPITDMNYLQRGLAQISPDQIPALIIFAFTYRSNADPSKYANLLNELDSTALKLLPKMDLDTTLRTLYAFLYLMPNWIMQIDFYTAAMKRITQNEFVDNTTKQKFVQICFYLGLNKNRNPQTVDSFNKLLHLYLDSYLLELSTLDLVVIANAAFKASIRIESELYNQRLEEEVKKLSLLEEANDALLITLIKAMRLQRIHSRSVWEHLGKYCTNDTLKRLQLRGCIHLFAYFADNLWDENNATEPLMEHCMQRLLPPKKLGTLSNEEVRCKDLATFLWCCAQLKCDISQNSFKQIEGILLSKIQQNEFRYFVDQLVDSCLSLWILNHRSRDLIEAAVDLKMREKNKNKRAQSDQPKIESRFQVLQSAVAIEEPTWASKSLKTCSKNDVNTAAPHYLLKSRSEFAEIKRKITELPYVDSVEVVCPINGINIPSLLVKQREPDNSIMFLEILSDEQELKCSKSPNGLMRLKIRLLKSMGYKVTTLSAARYEKDNASIEDLLSNVEAKGVPEAQSLKI